MTKRILILFVLSFFLPFNSVFSDNKILSPEDYVTYIAHETLNVLGNRDKSNDEKVNNITDIFLSNLAVREISLFVLGPYRRNLDAEQKTNIRYLSLTFGGHIFGVLLSFGSISLLGSLAEKGSQQELDPELRKIKRKSMLIAVQRGFIAMTCWSPLTYSIAITTSIKPGSSWNGAAFSCVISALILIFLGWIIDSRNNGQNKKQISICSLGISIRRR